MEAVAKIPIFPVFVLFIAGFIPGSIPIIIKLGKFCLKCFIIIEIAVLQATTRASILYFSSKYLVILSHLANISSLLLSPYGAYKVSAT